MVAVVDLDDKYRYDKMLKLQQDMEKELIKYETVYTKYKKCDKICTELALGLALWVQLVLLQQLQ